MIDGISFALADDRWQMAPGTRAAIVGILAQVKPKIAVELGTFEGGALRMLAQHSEEVHTFDLDPQVEVVPANVTLHRGNYFNSSGVSEPARG